MWRALPPHREKHVAARRREYRRAHVVAHLNGAGWYNRPNTNCCEYATAVKIHADLLGFPGVAKAPSSLISRNSCYTRRPSMK